MRVKLFLGNKGRNLCINISIACAYTPLEEVNHLSIMLPKLMPSDGLPLQGVFFSPKHSK